MKRSLTGLRLGVVLLESDHAVETLNLPDPFNAPAPPGLLPILMGHPAFWPVPTAFAIADGVTSEGLIEGTASAFAGVAAAVDRLAPHCDVVVGDCGYMYSARSAVRSDTCVLLSGLQLLPNALESTRRPVGILTFNRVYTERMLASHPERGRLRIVGLNHKPGLSAFGSADYTVNEPVSVDQIRAEILQVCSLERQSGAFADIGSLVLQCTLTPAFRTDLVAAMALPIWDVAAVARSLVGA